MKKLEFKKLHWNINIEAAKALALSSNKTDQYKYLTGEEILPSNQIQMIQETKFTYLLLGKAFEKQTKAIADEGKKHVEALEILKSPK